MEHFCHTNTYHLKVSNTFSKSNHTVNQNTKSLTLTTTSFLKETCFPCGELSAQRISAFKSEQSTAGCMAIFHKYCCCTKHGDVVTLVKSLGACYWLVKTPQWGYMEHGLRYITFYVQIHMAPLAVCSGPHLDRNKPLGAPAFVRLVYCCIPGMQNGRHFTDDIFNAFSWRKSSVFWFEFHWSLFVRVQLTIIQCWFNYGLLLNRRQAIIWTNADPVYWRIYAALGADELMWRWIFKKFRDCISAT